MKIRVKIFIIIAFGSVLTLYSCKQKKICAAYSSYHVFDATNLGYYFTPFGADSVPVPLDSNYFKQNGLVDKDGGRNFFDKSLYEIDIRQLRARTTMPDTSMIGDDSIKATLSTKELFPERINTDQQAYEHYVGELLKKYQKETAQPQATADTSSSDNFARPENMTKEEKAQWKKEKKERKRKQREERRKAAEQEDDDDFDLDLGDI